VADALVTRPPFVVESPISKPTIPSPPPAGPSADELLALSDIDLVEHVAARVAGLLVKASAVADRSEYLPCLDSWASRERLARIDDVIWAGQRLLRRLSAA
jgi:hypothetical protein